MQPIQDTPPEVLDPNELQKTLDDTEDPGKEPPEPPNDGEIPDKPDFLKGINWQLKQQRKEEDDV